MRSTLNCLALVSLMLINAPSNAASQDIIATELEYPWSVTFLSEHKALVTERTGGLVLVDTESQSVSDIPLTLTTLWVEGQAGLFEVALHPDFQNNGFIYLSYACGNARANNTCLAKAEWDGDSISQPEQIFRAQPERRGSAHYGGRIAFLPDNTLILTLGDGFDYREDAQRPGSHNGKLVRLNADGSTPQDNPFVKHPDFRDEIYSLGHRNVQGIVWDDERNTLWSTEHGPRGGDELNRIAAGNNYGWPLLTGGVDYTGALITPHKSLPDMAAPIVEWTPSIAPSGLTLHRGDLFVPALAARKIVQVHLNEQGAVIGQTDHLIELGERIRDIRTNPYTGELYFLTDSPHGKLIRLSLE